MTAVMTTRHMLAFPGHVSVDEDHPVAIVIDISAPTGLTMGPAMSTVRNSTVLIHAVGLHQVVTATRLLVRTTVIAGPAISTKHASEHQAHVLMALRHTSTVILISVLIIHTMVLATSTRDPLLVHLHAMELQPAVTATALIPLLPVAAFLALVTSFVELAIHTKRMSEVLAHVLMELNQTVGTVILLPVLLIHTVVLATSIESTVLLTPARELDLMVGATSILAQLCMLGSAICTKRHRKVMTTAVG